MGKNDSRPRNTFRHLLSIREQGAPTPHNERPSGGQPVSKRNTYYTQEFSDKKQNHGPNLTGNGHHGGEGRQRRYLTGLGMPQTWEAAPHPRIP